MHIVVLLPSIIIFIVTLGDVDFDGTTLLIDIGVYAVVYDGLIHSEADGLLLEPVWLGIASVTCTSTFKGPVGTPTPSMY